MSYSLETVLLFITMFGSLFIINDSLLRLKKSVVYVIPLLTLTCSWFWYQYGNMDPFLWAKIYSLTFAVAFFNYLISKKTKITDLERKIVYLILALNILEAAITDLTHGTLFGYLNAGFGLLLIILLPSIKSIQIEKSILSWKGLSLLWVVFYTFWNLTFIFNTYPEFFVKNIIALSIPLIYEVIYPSKWLQVRANSLFAYIFIGFSFPQLSDRLDVPILATYEFIPLILIIGSFVSLVLMYFKSKDKEVKTV